MSSGRSAPSASIIPSVRSRCRSCAHRTRSAAASRRARTAASSVEHASAPRRGLRLVDDEVLEQERPGGVDDEMRGARERGMALEQEARRDHRRPAVTISLDVIKAARGGSRRARASPGVRRARRRARGGEAAREARWLGARGPLARSVRASPAAHGDATPAMRPPASRRGGLQPGACRPPREHHGTVESSLPTCQSMCDASCAGTESSRVQGAPESGAPAAGSGGALSAPSGHRRRGSRARLGRASGRRRREARWRRLRSASATARRRASRRRESRSSSLRASGRVRSRRRTSTSVRTSARRAGRIDWRRGGDGVPTGAQSRHLREPRPRSGTARRGARARSWARSTRDRSHSSIPSGTTSRRATRAGRAARAYWCARAHFVRSIGFDDTHFFLHGDDVDLSWRLRLAGWRVRTRRRPSCSMTSGSAAHGSIEPSETEVYHSLRARLLLARRLREPRHRGGDDRVRRAEWNEIRRSSRSPTTCARSVRAGAPEPIPGAERVAQFIDGEYAEHRF